MASLFDTVQQNTQAAASAATAGPTDASQQNVTGQVQSLLQAKSGKAVSPGATPRASNIQEQQANATGQAQGKKLAIQVQASNQVLATNVEQQGQAIVQQQKEQTFQAAKVESDFLRNSDILLNQYVQGEKQLDLNKDKAKFEQIGFQLRLSDQQYVDNLNREGQLSRLDNDIAFKNEMARTAFSDELDLFHDNMDFRASIFASKEDFNEKMSNMDIDFALGMAKQANNQASANMMWAGVGTLVSGGAKAYAASSNSTANATAAENTANAQEGSAWGTPSPTSTALPEGTGNT